MINFIEVKNLGPVKEWKANFRELNIFIGPNGSGKSYVNMVLYSMLQVANRKNNDGDIKQKLQFVFQEKEVKRLITWKEREAKVSIYMDEGELILELYKQKEPIFQKNINKKIPIDEINFISMPDVLNVYSAINIFTQEHPGSLGVSETIIDFLTRILNLEYPEKAKNWKNLLKKIENKINARFSVEKGKITASFKREKLNIERVASGLKTFSLIYLALKQGIIASGGILFLEEPEEHLHPEWQVIMAEILVEMALKGVQIFVSTHSDDLLKKVNNLLQKDSNLKDKVKAYLFTTDGFPKELEIDVRGIDLLPLLETFYKLYEEEQERL